MSDAGTLVSGIGGRGGAPGVDALQELTNSGLANVDGQGRLRAQLGEKVPSIENGLWSLLPDGRMRTTWTLRRAAQWHDGAPFTTADLVFSARVWQDRELPISRDPIWDSVEELQATDPYTLVVVWRRPFIEADTLFSAERSLPVPRHLLERPYVEDKESFADLPFWSEGFVGTGPFRLREWQRGSHLILVANPAYALGQPRVDEVEVRFVPDSEALVANVLANRVELTLGGRGLSLEQGLQIRDQWREGQMELTFRNWVGLYPQFLNPNPGVVANVQFRRALVHAIDRQEMADTLMRGVVPVAHSYLNPSDPSYPAVAPLIVRYDYDPRRAAQMIEELAYTRDGAGLFRDATNQPLAVEIRTTGEDDVQVKTLLSIADYWRRVGVGNDPVLIPPARTRDREYRTNYPGFQVLQQPNDPASLRHLHGSAARLPPDYGGRNQARYMNAEFDALLDTYFTTVPQPERVEVLGRAVRHISEQLNVMGIFYNVQPTLISNRLRNVTAGYHNSTQAWNAEEWDVQ